MMGLTPRQLHQIAEKVDAFTKARKTNQQMGVATTPDVFTVNLPGRITGTLTWTEARGLTPRQSQSHHGGKPVWRYLVTLGTGQAEPKPPAKPAPAEPAKPTDVLIAEVWILTRLGRRDPDDNHTGIVGLYPTREAGQVDYDTLVSELAHTAPITKTEEDNGALQVSNAYDVVRLAPYDLTIPAED